MTTESERFWRNVEPDEGCLIWTAGLTGGYGQFWAKDRRVRAHRFAWEEANGPIPEGLCVLHKCDRPPCVNVSHLFLGTRADNNRDMTQKGRGRRPMLRGELHGRSVLTPSKVMTIRALKAYGAPYRMIGDALGVAHGTVHNVLSGRCWGHVGDDGEDKG